MEAELFSWSLESLDWTLKKILIQDYTLNFKDSKDES